MRICLSFLLALVASCGGSGPLRTSSAEPSGTSTAHDAMDRHTFNRMALRMNLPLFWLGDSDSDGAVDPAELRVLSFYGDSTRWLDDGAFTSAFEEAYGRMAIAAGAPEPQDARMRMLLQELASAEPTLVESDLTSLPAPERAFAAKMLEALAVIDAIYARQTGMEALVASHGAPQDAASASVLRRNWGASCRSPALEGEDACTAISGVTEQPVDVYPNRLQGDESFCDDLQEHADADELLSPFTVVREREGELFAQPYSEVYAELLEQLASHLEEAAQALVGTDERSLQQYLQAVAGACRTNDWFAADEAWAAMDGHNSAWYVRVGPDEVYWDPCSRKAGFHMTLARIDASSLEWQRRLEPIQEEMEARIAALSSAYDASDVAFHLPEFINIVANAGDDRDPFGATIGQSLPNWGPVAESNRGRTVVMSNLYTDPDSTGRRRQIAESLLTADAMAPYTDAPTPGLVSTILHEATHNLGPTNEYRVRGRNSAAAFGGPMASMLEELKAQTGALFLLQLLSERGVLTGEQVQQAYLDSMVWALGHIARGMYTPSGQRKAYSQLAAIQVGYLLERGVMVWNDDAIAANGSDRGAYSINYEAMAAAAQQLMADVVTIMATHDVEGARRLTERFVDGDRPLHHVSAERHRRFPKQAFVYSISL